MNDGIDAMRISRRAMLRAGVAGLLCSGGWLTGCASTPTTANPTPTTGASSPTTGTSSGGTDPAAGGASTLLVYFSRAGENYFNGGRTFLDVGNTEVVAELIRTAIPVDVYRIEASEPYPDGYDATVARNVR